MGLRSGGLEAEGHCWLSGQGRGKGGGWGASVPSSEESFHFPSLGPHHPQLQTPRLRSPHGVVSGQLRPKPASPSPSHPAPSPPSCLSKWHLLPPRAQTQTWESPWNFSFSPLPSTHHVVLLSPPCLKFTPDLTNPHLHGRHPDLSHHSAPQPATCLYLPAPGSTLES